LRSISPRICFVRDYQHSALRVKNDVLMVEKWRFPQFFYLEKTDFFSKKNWTFGGTGFGGVARG
jgi:hypothetical protein